jgi:murein DD-endopeptidase MepM/ murein hydrolase activator NlpD
MKSRRFVLILMDSTGRWVRRVAIPRRTVEVCAAMLAVILTASVVITTHGLLTRPVAAQSAAMREENQQLQALLAELQASLPAMRRDAMQVEVGFAQLWTKSGVGIEPRMLAVGPIAIEGATAAGGGRSNAAPISGDVMDLSPIALPLEVERMRQDGEHVQHMLADLLEYFHDAERLLSHTPSIRPVHTPWISSTFGKRRDPMKGDWLMHKGLDLSGQTGNEIFSPADGVVIYTGRRGGYGLTVVIHHGWGLQTHFAHLSRFRVQVGEPVTRGQLIAEMGSTGKSTGPHLHYEVRRWGQPLDPARFILD